MRLALVSAVCAGLAGCAVDEPLTGTYRDTQPTGSVAGPSRGLSLGDCAQVAYDAAGTAYNHPEAFGQTSAPLPPQPLVDAQVDGSAH